MKLVKLEDVCYSGSSNISQKDVMILDGSYPIYGASGFIKNINFYKSEKPYIAIVKDGSGVGRTMILPEKSSVIGTMNYIFPRDNIDIRYLYYAITSIDLSKYCTGIAIPHIYFKDYKKEKLNLPSISEQVNIANKLDLAQKIIDLKQQQIKNLDELIKSQFVEMFGDPILNNKNWKISKWNEVLTIKNGKSQKKVEQENGQYPIYGSGGIMSYANDYICNENSVIIGRKGNINNPILVRTKFWNVDTAFGLEPCKEKMIVEYLYYFCYFYNFEKHNKAVTIPSLTKTDLLNIYIPIPPIDLQNRFADIVKQIDKHKFILEKSLKETEELKKSLMNKYFG